MYIAHVQNICKPSDNHVNRWFTCIIDLSICQSIKKNFIKYFDRKQKNKRIT